MYRLTKSLLMSLHQCPLRFWQQVYEPALARPASVATFNAMLGDEIGAIARRLLGPGVLIGHVDAPLEAVRATQERLAEPGPLCLFEAAFVHAGVLVRVDMLTRDEVGRYRLSEVKSALSVKPHHILDAAIQTWVLRQSGIALSAIEVVHVDPEFVAGEPGDFAGLLCALDVTQRIEAQSATVVSLVERALTLLDGGRPFVIPGRHCQKPHSCSFDAACRASEPEYPVRVLPRLSDEDVGRLLAAGVCAVQDIPPTAELRPVQRRWADVIRNGTPWLDVAGIRAELSGLPWPRFYVDFETVGFAAPRWRGARPREQHIFQWALLIEHAPGELEHRAFLAGSDQCPVEDAVRSLIAACGRHGPVIHYGVAERSNLTAAKRLVPALAQPLLPLESRMYDLLKRVVQNRVVIPAMRGSHSLKSVHPALTGRDAYAALDGVHEGMGASAAYLRMVDPECPSSERARLRDELLAYCALDVVAMRDIVIELGRRVSLTEPQSEALA